MEDIAEDIVKSLELAAEVGAEGFSSSSISLSMKEGTQDIGAIEGIVKSAI